MYDGGGAAAERPVAAGTITVAVIGSPNAGKSTLVSALTGIPQRTGNYSGVTVAPEAVTFEGLCFRWTLIDLPGSYSLAAQSPDEAVAARTVLGLSGQTDPPDVMLCVVSAPQLQQHLFLVSQLLEAGHPLVVALNQVDRTEASGGVDVEALSDELGVPVVATVATEKRGVKRLIEVVEEAARKGRVPAPPPLPAMLEEPLRRLEKQEARGSGRFDVSRALRVRLLVDGPGVLGADGGLPERDVCEPIAAERRRLVGDGTDLVELETAWRLDWARRVMARVGANQPLGLRRPTWTERLDRVAVHPVLGPLLFLAVMFVLFQSVFRWSAWPMDALDAACSWLQASVRRILPDGVLASLLADGVVAGAGNVILFVPQIAILFCFIAILEECGYLARAAFLMDRIMAPVGLSGRAFIPLLSSFACAIPGILATRTIADRHDRMTTILIAPLMSCSARLPVYFLLASTFLPDRTWLGGLISLPALVIAGMYGLGIVVAMVVAWVLRGCVFRGPRSALVLEMPDYRIPSGRVVWHRVREATMAFVRDAGTVILAVTIVVWAAGSFPRQTDRIRQAERALAGAPEAEAKLAAIRLEESVLGRMGKAIEPAVRPLGWDWRIACAVLASFPAREAVIGALGVIYQLGPVEGEDDASALRARLRAAQWADSGRPVFTIPVALGLMVFFALCAQCGATLAVIGRETGSYGWSVMAFVYLTALAYAGAWATYQIGSWWMGG